MENDARHNNKHPRPKEHLDLREVTDQWMKKFGHLFTRLDTPEPIADPNRLSEDTASAPITNLRAPTINTTNLMNNNACLSNIERACSKADVVDDFGKVLDRWARKFNEFFDGCNNSLSITDPIQPKNNTP
jgi:hypothetical protein